MYADEVKPKTVSGNLTTVYKEIRLLVAHQLGEYRAEIERQRISRPHLLNIPLFSSLHGRVTTTAIRKLFHELEYSRKPEFPTTCSCNITKTCGLPCAHEVSRYNGAGTPIPASAIHSHWWYSPPQHSSFPVEPDVVIREPRSILRRRRVELPSTNQSVGGSADISLSQDSYRTETNEEVERTNPGLLTRKQGRGTQSKYIPQRFCHMLTMFRKTLLL